MAGTVALMGSAFIFAWSGLYDIATSGGHWKIVERFPEFGMRNSVKTNAAGIEAPQLDNPDLIRLGAAHFHRGCAFCHGAPGMLVNPIAKQMLPSPPDLSVSMRPWKERELFWIVKHGFKYTGMPGWVALEREDKIWAVVAFLTQLPNLDAEGYRDLALGDVRVEPRSGSELATLESNPEAFSACARCHGGEGERPMSNLVPVLHGQPADYLMSALKAYAEGKRRSGIMQPLAARGRLRVEPGLGPRLLWRGAPEHDPVVQPERTAPPELDLERNQPIASPIGRAGYRAITKGLGEALYFRFEGGAAGERPRLKRGASADAALAMAGGKIGVGLG
jgi:cytochrome c553